MKILVIRLSSIGDIVLTTPVIRCLKQQLPSAELHFLCKPGMKAVVETNPYLDDVHTFRKDDRSLVRRLREESFDYVVDLQKNRHSRRICRRLHLPYASFPKLNLRKLLLVAFKWNCMPDVHIVDRYFRAVARLGVKNDGKGLDFFTEEKDVQELEPFSLPGKYIALAVGSQHATKQIPFGKMEEIIAGAAWPVVLLGDSRDAVLAEKLQALHPGRCISLCGKLSLRASAACVAGAHRVLSGDTGLMHIAAAYGKRTVSVWGNTVPALGMYPYMPQHRENSVIIENNDCPCRPCSKLGHSRCPHKHFRCMEGIPAARILKSLNDED